LDTFGIEHSVVEESVIEVHEVEVFAESLPVESKDQPYIKNKVVYYNIYANYEVEAGSKTG